MMTFATVLIWLGLFASFAFVCALLLRNARLRATIGSMAQTHISALDGLRGVLAFSVFVHHAYLTRLAALTGSWGTPDDAFVQLLGLGPVAIFFMITAFLFWSRALATKGHFAPLGFYRSRLRRIYPAFAGSIVSLLLVVAWQTHLRLDEPLALVAGEVARQFSLGIATGSTIDGLAHADLIDAGVTWSLGFECGFYAILPFLALAIRARASWVAGSFVLALAIAFERHLWIVVAFLPGIAAAEIATRPRISAWFARYGNRVAYVGCAALALALALAPHALLTLAHGPKLDVALQLAGLCAIFAGVTLGPGPSILKRIEIRFAGTISYSVYLLHGIVLYVVSHAIATFVPIERLSPVAYGSVILGCVPILALVATGSFLILERPFLQGRWPRELAPTDGRLDGRSRSRRGDKGSY